MGLPTALAGLLCITSIFGIMTLVAAPAGAAGVVPHSTSAKVVRGHDSTSQAGYRLAASDGGVFTFGDAGYFGSEGGNDLAKPIVGIAASWSGNSYYLVASDGGIFTFGDAQHEGSEGAAHLAEPIVGVSITSSELTDPSDALAPTPDGKGYWIVSENGTVSNFGDAKNYGSETNSPNPVIGIAATPDGKGYWLADTAGDIYTFGDAGFSGSLGNEALNEPITDLVATPDGKGYWLVAADGGIFTFGDAGFYGSEGAASLSAPIDAVASTPDGKSRWLLGTDGGVCTFGDAGFSGSLLGEDGAVNTHGDAPYLGGSNSSQATSGTGAPGGDGYVPPRGTRLEVGIGRSASLPCCRPCCKTAASGRVTR